MVEIILFLFFFYFFLLSTIGYGFLFQNYCFKKILLADYQNIIYVGFYGLFALTFISLLSSLFFPHGFIHNILIHFFGILFFIIFKIKKRKKYLINIFTISVFLFSALLISKTHDDFPYYHLPFTKYLTEHHIIFGIGNLSHGFKLISSLFFLNSTYYLPYIEFYSFHFSSFFFLIFSNYFLLKEIFSKSTNENIRYFYLITFVFFNLSFNRLAEFGTDKAGQILIVLLVIKIYQVTLFEKSKNNLNSILLILPLLGLCITLKTYFLTYLLLGFVILIFNQKLEHIIKKLFLSRSFLFFSSILFFYFLQHFFITGCIISPISSTCFGDNLKWASDRLYFENLSAWLEQWAKAGAGPNFRVENAKDYVENFNWISRWFEYYFIEKPKEQLLIYLSIILIIFFFFKDLKLNNNVKIFNNKIILFYSIILIIFLIWFIKHPSLRYGGYAIFFLVLSIPTTLFLDSFISKESFNKRAIILILLVLVIFNVKNIIRIKDELNREDYYKFNNFPFFSIKKKDYVSKKTTSGLMIYKTDGHCWDTPSPCFMSLGKLNLDIIKKNGYYFLIKK